MIDAIAALLGNLAEAIVLTGNRLSMSAADAVDCGAITGYPEGDATNTGITSFINAALMPFIDKAGDFVLNIGVLIEKLADAMLSLA